MQIKAEAVLAPYSTFFIGGLCRYLIYAQDQQEIIEALNFAHENNLPVLILGGGSNMLISDQGFNGVVVRIETIGFDIIEDSDESVVLRVASGEVWDDVVRFAVENNWWGIENLSHIPGFCGAFCVQNVGAYGQEASQVVTAVRVLDRETLQIQTLDKKLLHLGYRTSIFNSTQKGKYIILDTDIKLSKIPKPNLTYGDLAVAFKNNLLPELQEIRQKIISIRNSKFPFPSQPNQGNSGSFFRGPLLTAEEFENLTQLVGKNFGEETKNKLVKMKDRLSVPQGFKTPTAFLIQLCGMNDAVFGGAQINHSQPAVITNSTGHATAMDVLGLYAQVRDKVFERTGVTLGIEPELIGFSVQDLAQFNIPSRQ